MGMAKWIFATILSAGILTSYPLFVEGLPLRQLPSPLDSTECEFDALEQYDEQCGSQTVTLPSCIPGERRIWWCEAGTNGFPDGFDRFQDACDNCPEDTFRSRYNKCRTCHPCSGCGEGETEEKACEVDHDTVCKSVEPVSTTSSLPLAQPLKEATPVPPERATPPPYSSIPATPTDGTTLGPTNVTDLPRESTVEPPKATPYMNVTIIAVIIGVICLLLVLLLILAVILGCRERRLRKRRQDIPLQAILNNNEAVPHEPEEIAALLVEGLPAEGAEIGRNPMNGNAMQATANPAVVGATGIRSTKEADDGVVVIDGATGTPDSTADDASGGGTDGAISGTPDTPQVDTSSSPDGCGGSTDAANDGRQDGAIPEGRLNDPTTFNATPGARGSRASESSADDHTDSAYSGAMGTSDGLVVDIPDETSVDASDDSIRGPPDVLTTSTSTVTSDASTASTRGDRFTVDSGNVCTSSEVDAENIHNEPTIASNNGAIAISPGDHALSDTTLDKTATNDNSDGNGGCSNGANSGAVVSGGGIDVPVDDSSHDVPVSPSDGAIRDTTSEPTCICTSPNNSLDEAPSKSGCDGIDDFTGGTNGGAMATCGEKTATNASGDGNGVCPDGTDSGDKTAIDASNNGTSACTDRTHSVAVASGGVDESPHGVSVGAGGGACAPLSDGAGDDDVRRTSTATEEIKPGIKADNVVTTQFLQLVADLLPHIKIKMLCRILGIEERDIMNVETLTHKDEQAFEFLKTLLGRIGKEFTYRSLIIALNKSNKYYADILISELNILL